MPSTFRTLEREEAFRNPSDKKFGTPALQEVVKPHLESFDSLTQFGDDSEAPGLIDLAIKDIGRKTVFDGMGENGLGNKITYWINRISISKPTVSARDTSSLNQKIYPSECRERLITYRGKLQAHINWTINDGPVNTEIREMGYLPLMVKSNKCHLHGLYSKDLIRHHEESEEMGGYFIVNGIEKIIRLLIVPRRNHVVAIIRNSFTNRGPTYSQYGCSIRCTRPDQTSLTNTVHYLTDGNAMIRFAWRKQEYMIPVIMILKALIDTSDKEIFDALCQGDIKNTFLTDRVELLLRSFKVYNLYTRESCLRYLGDKFRVVMDVAEDMTDVQVGEELLRKAILVHLKDGRDKFNLLVFMIRKLYSLVSGECCEDNPDSPQHQEVLLGGHLYGMILKEKLYDWLGALKSQIRTDIRLNSSKVDFMNSKCSWILDKSQNSQSRHPR